MDTTDLKGFILDDKPVFDWHNRPIGTVADLRRDPRTKATRQVVVNLSQDARRTLGTTEELLEIPVSFIFGIRKDAVSLDRSVEELKKIETLSATILKR